jgi:hypothetical protein
MRSMVVVPAFGRLRIFPGDASFRSASPIRMSILDMRRWRWRTVQQPNSHLRSAESIQKLSFCRFHEASTESFGGDPADSKKPLIHV